MYPANDYMLKVITDETTQRYIRQAEIDHLLSEVEPRQPSGLAYRVRPALHKLGHLFLALGAWVTLIGNLPGAAKSENQLDGGG